MSDQDPAYLETKFMVDPYMNWLVGEGVPIHTGPAIDTLTASLQPWSRFGMNGAACHVEGSCDFLTAFVFELGVGKSSAEIRHVYEQVHYVLAGQGRTEITLSDGRQTTIEWHEKNLFAVPVNAKARHFPIGSSTVRLIAFSNIRYLLGLYRNEKFLFENDAAMIARQQKALDAGLTSNPLLVRPGSDELTPIGLADMSIGIDVTCFNPNSSLPARRQMQGRHVMGIDGHPQTVSFASEEDKGKKTSWQHGILAGLRGIHFHRHVNDANVPARMLSVEMGSVSSPMFRSRRHIYGDKTVYASGAALID
jgi:hypothetical protein